ncbi:RIP metalloprotease RseP [Enterococcus sp. MJM12]|uniref:Zinc metalloprotease n=1 Tax=Candidatus Enterococcus myersii TaxID=2815322 RepID=A0ABS3HCC4_9ENTE|nr:MULTISPECIES: RIP metalloprotease RseP [Enterococcus]MBO0450570.1 RIP metalloprotease RseP [Enterococcus sp. MJM12]MCD1023418.1 RIP metalloprotease RseP [Enterococcus sp. SMC-9]MDT2738694.1 RIP metalloprotease RseP [Enterococcus canintestini]
MKTLITFIIVFSVIVIIHEFGHYFFAKRAGILVREFAIGMGPKIWGHQGKDGTTFTLRALPIGGYVRMAGNGEDEVELTPGMPIGLVLDEKGKVTQINTSSKVQLVNAFPFELAEFDLEDKLFVSGYQNGDESQLVTYDVLHDATIIESDGVEVRIAPRDVQFQSAKLWQRMLTNFAGPMNNFLLAIVLFIVITFIQGGVAITNTNKIGAISENSPAQSAKLKEGDAIQSIDGQKISSWDDLTAAITGSKKSVLNFTVKRENETFTTQVKPEKEEVDGQKVVRIGVQVPMDTSFLGKFTGGIKQAANSSVQLLRALGNLIAKPDINKLGGPVAMFQMSSEAAKQGPLTVMVLMAVISMNLGVMNLLPIPALDGGKIVLNVIEGLRGKPLSQEKEGILTLIGFGFLLLLMVLVTWNDIQRWFF